MAAILFKTEHHWKTERHCKKEQKASVRILNEFGILAPTVKAILEKYKFPVK